MIDQHAHLTNRPTNRPICRPSQICGAQVWKDLLKQKLLIHGTSSIWNDNNGTLVRSCAFLLHSFLTEPVV